MSPLIHSSGHTLNTFGRCIKHASRQSNKNFGKFAKLNQNQVFTLYCCRLYYFWSPSDFLIFHRDHFSHCNYDISFIFFIFYFGIVFYLPKINNMAMITYYVVVNGLLVIGIHLTLNVLPIVKCN